MLTGSEDSKELGHEADEENDEVRCTLLSVTAGVLVVIDLQLCSHYWSAKDSQQQFGEYEVTLKTIHHNQGFKRRMLQVTNTKVSHMMLSCVLIA